MSLLNMHISDERSLLEPVALCLSHTWKDQVSLLRGTAISSHKGLCVFI